MTNDILRRLKSIYGKQYVEDRINGLINIRNTHAVEDRMRNMRLALTLGFGGNLADHECWMIITSVMNLDLGIVSVRLSDE